MSEFVNLSGTQYEVRPPDAIVGPTRVVYLSGRGFAVPARAPMIWSKNGKIAYLLHEGEVRALTPAGELELPVALRARIRSHYFEGGER